MIKCDRFAMLETRNYPKNFFKKIYFFFLKSTVTSLYGRWTLNRLKITKYFNELIQFYSRFEFYSFQLNLHLLKSISGCSFINFAKTSCFFWSSLVGRPNSFCFWSYIIFSTIERVSPSKSLSFEGSGFILRVEIGGSLLICWNAWGETSSSREEMTVLTNLSHQLIWLIFSKEITIAFLSIVHSESSVFISAFHSPSMTGGWFFKPTLIVFFVIVTTTSRDLRFAMFLNGTRS